MSLHIWILGVREHYRGLELEAQLKSSGIDFSNYWGVDANGGFDLEELGSPDFRFAEFAIGRPLTDGEIACAIGHLGIYQEFLHSNFEWALIFEDDAQIIDLKSFFDLNLTHINEPIVISLHDGPGFRFKRPSKIAITLSRKFVRMQKLLELPSCAHGYLINRKAVEMINFTAARKLLTVADWPYIFSYKYKLFSTVIPLVTIKDSTKSLIGDRTNFQSQGINFWKPSYRRARIASEFGIDLKLAIYREVIIKVGRVYHRVLQKLQN